MANIKRIILTRQQLNEVLKEDGSQTLKFTMPKGGNTSQVLSSPEAQRAIQKAQGIFGNSNITAQVQPDEGPSDVTFVSPTPTGGGNGANNVNTADDTAAVEHGCNVEYDVSNTASESRTFSKKQIEEARLKKIQEGFKFTKKQLKESFVDEYTYGTYLEKGLSPEEIKKRQMEDDWVKIEEKPYMYDTSTDDYYNYNVFDDAFIASGRKKSGRLDAFGDDARVKRFNGTKNSVRKIKESFDTDEQWNDEINMFMRGLRRGDYMLDGDTLYVEIFRGQTPENDPRYAYIRKGEDKLHDDHFYMQDSPRLSDSQLKDIYYNAGWEDILPELVDYNGFEAY